jgi:hypothetical protein
VSERNSPYYAAGVEDGTADAMRSPRHRTGFDPGRARSWMYRRGFARGFLATRRLCTAAPADNRPGTLAAMQAGLDRAWAVLDAAQNETRKP